jgi:hypothetical protein
MLLIKHKMMLFCKVAFSRPMGWMMAGGSVTEWYQSDGFDVELGWAK